VLLPNRARGTHEPDGEAHGQDYEGGDRGPPHIYIHEDFDNENNEKVLAPA
jgi:hypothetical protein